VCEQGSVVDGVYTREVLPAGQYQSLLASPPRPSVTVSDSSDDRHSSVQCCSEHTSITSVSAHSAAVSSTEPSSSAHVSASPSGRQSALQVAVQPSVSSSHVSSLSSPPLMTGILAPAANINTKTSPVVTATHHQSVDKTQTDNGWKEFEEALSDEFISFDSCQQSKDVVPSSYVPPPLPPSFTIPSTTSCCTLH